jgi:hypothetical protein
MAKREKKVPISLAECQRQLVTFNHVIGYYDINHTVKEATEIINNYDQAHDDDQALISEMDHIIAKRGGQVARLIKLVEELIPEIDPDLVQDCLAVLEEVKSCQ